MNVCPKCGREYIERHYYAPPESGESFVAYIHEIERLGKGRVKVTDTCDVPADKGEGPQS